ncbi:hypothetical protein XH89_00560 [Bradyrhizobium sp. CCBAU 53340]|nr:hypothetical protein XH89_00560 [Bradyrhizobium sp. CCBAU 53340]
MAATMSTVIASAGLSTPSLRAQRSDPESFCGGILDCFVASAQNCYAILSRAPRNDDVEASLPKMKTGMPSSEGMPA